MLLEHGEEALALAGGTALVLLLRQRVLSARYFVDLTVLPGLREVAWDDDAGARIGALATLRDVERSPALRAALPIVPETYATVGNVRIRNAATVGGNLAHGDYRLDPPAALLALDARVHIAGPRGPRELPLAGFFRGFEETALERGELITAVTIAPPPTGAAGAYVKFSSLGADDWPCVGAAALVALDGADRIAGPEPMAHRDRPCVGDVTQVQQVHRLVVEPLLPFDPRAPIGSAGSLASGCSWSRPRTRSSPGRLDN